MIVLVCPSVCLSVGLSKVMNIQSSERMYMNLSPEQGPYTSGVHIQGYFQVFHGHKKINSRLFFNNLLKNSNTKQQPKCFISVYFIFSSSSRLLSALFSSALDFARRIKQLDASTLSASLSADFIRAIMSTFRRLFFAFIISKSNQK